MNTTPSQPNNDTNNNNDLRQYRTWGLTLLQLMGVFAISGFVLTALLNYFL